MFGLKIFKDIKTKRGKKKKTVSGASVRKKATYGKYVMKKNGAKTAKTTGYTTKKVDTKEK